MISISTCSPLAGPSPWAIGVMPLITVLWTVKGEISVAIKLKLPLLESCVAGADFHVRRRVLSRRHVLCADSV